MTKKTDDKLAAKMARIEKLKEQMAQEQEQLKKLNAQKATEDRKHDAHIKATMGGVVAKMLREEFAINTTDLTRDQAALIATDICNKIIEQTGRNYFKIDLAQIDGRIQTSKGTDAAE